MSGPFFHVCLYSEWLEKGKHLLLGEQTVQRYPELNDRFASMFDGKLRVWRVIHIAQVIEPPESPYIAVMVRSDITNSGSNFVLPNYLRDKRAPR